jgi:hypothetical protein
MTSKVAIVFVRKKRILICPTVVKFKLTFVNQYSIYGHVKLIAEAEQAGLKKASIDADIFQ